jgi:hypothetical protein
VIAKSHHLEVRQLIDTNINITNDTTTTTTTTGNDNDNDNDVTNLDLHRMKDERCKGSQTLESNSSMHTYLYID